MDLIGALPSRLSSYYLRRSGSNQPGQCRSRREPSFVVRSVLGQNQQLSPDVPMPKAEAARIIR